MRRQTLALALAVTGLATALACQAAGDPDSGALVESELPEVAAAQIDAPQPSEHVEVPPPPFSDGIYPCSFCHADFPPDRTRRELFFHSEIVLRHDEEHRWCLDCHDADNRDVLHLASGAPVAFDESYLLCGQCHGEKLRDWRAGVHGRRTGEWNGRKGYLLCVHCHSPHEPRFKPLEPMPAPRPPSRPGGGG